MPAVRSSSGRVRTGVDRPPARYREGNYMQQRQTTPAEGTFDLWGCSLWPGHWAWGSSASLASVSGASKAEQDLGDSQLQEFAEWQHQRVVPGHDSAERSVRRRRQQLRHHPHREGELHQLRQLCLGDSPGPVRRSSPRVSGGQDGGVPTVNGCTVPGNEDCSGPYTKFGSTVHHMIFPAGGFSTSIKIYIDAAWAAAHPGNVVDWDVAASGQFGEFPRRTMPSTCARPARAAEGST